MGFVSSGWRNPFIEERALEPSEVRVCTLYSGISAGTEMTIYRGSNPYAKKRWDGELKSSFGGEVAFPDAEKAPSEPAAESAGAEAGGGGPSEPHAEPPTQPRPDVAEPPAAGYI